MANLKKKKKASHVTSKVLIYKSAIHFIVCTYRLFVRNKRAETSCLDRPKPKMRALVYIILSDYIFCRKGKAKRYIVRITFVKKQTFNICNIFLTTYLNKVIFIFSKRGARFSHLIAHFPSYSYFYVKTCR